MMIRWCLLIPVLLMASEFEDPTQSIKSIVNETMVHLKDSCQLGKNQSEVTEDILAVFIPHVDMALITKQVLGRQHTQVVQEERLKLQSLLERLLARQYADAFHCEYLDNEMIFFPLREEVKKYTRVDSRIAFGENQRVQVRYAVRWDQDQWKIYDIVIDGLSIAQTYRSQFHRILRQGGVSHLIQYLDQKLIKNQSTQETASVQGDRALTEVESAVDRDVDAVSN